MDENYVYEQIACLSNKACQRMNAFSSQILKTRGGRIGSGMGTLLEALWGYMMNQIILEETDLDCEIAWFPDNQYNDFSCIRRDAVWDATTHAGEYFRIEAKSMNTGADESKAHFAALDSEIEQNDALLILIWEWRKIDDLHFSPIVIDCRRLINRQTHRFYWVFLHLLYKFSLRRWYNSSYHTNYPLPTEEKIYAY